MESRTYIHPTLELGLSAFLLLLAVDFGTLLGVADAFVGRHDEMRCAGVHAQGQGDRRLDDGHGLPSVVRRGARILARGP